MQRPVATVGHSDLYSRRVGADRHRSEIKNRWANRRNGPAQIQRAVRSSYQRIINAVAVEVSSDQRWVHPIGGENQWRLQSSIAISHKKPEVSRAATECAHGNIKSPVPIEIACRDPRRKTDGVVHPSRERPVPFPQEHIKLQTGGNKVQIAVAIQVRDSQTARQVIRWIDHGWRKSSPSVSQEHRNPFWINCKGQFQLAYDSSGSNGPSPFYELRGLLYGPNTAPIGQLASTNYERYSNPATDKLINEYGATADAAQQHAIVNQLEQVMLSQVPVIPITESVDWFQYDTSKFSGWVTQQDPYAQPAPYSIPDWGYQLLHLTPKG
jgi:hypothetical protein